MNSFRKIGSISLILILVFNSCNQQDDLTPVSILTETLSFDYKVIPGRYIITYKNIPNGRTIPVDYFEGKKIMREISREFLIEKSLSDVKLRRVYSGALRGFVADIGDDNVFKFIKDLNVKTVEPDYEIIMNAPPWARGNNGGGSDGQETPYGISRVNGAVTHAGSNVAWILDTGIDLDHNDLNVDASRGFNAFSSGKDAKSLDDGNGHGTHVAGTIAAIDNNTGVVGVAAGATVIPVKVLSSRGGGTYSGVIAGVDFVGAHGNAGDVANMSLGGPASSALDEAVKAAGRVGIKFALAAGNDSDNADSHSPARTNGTNIFTISAMDDNDNWASFSNYGNPPIDYCAPGVSIKSTWKGGGYKTISGTSMAAPHAAGVLLLGEAGADGMVNNDPDGTADPIIVHK